ncbi:hypothetical protein A0J57_04010 [Sphingobium sp. 22B]|uniref:methylmalonyl Co-A mutase-associated GTPase MeaB n=1 Tax=unclassified Sphingobium TaxID=2611147 RepID=UPI000784A793|nr:MULTISPECIES: methylmalonyl Co-A mutase-associated GTPase MeaB [unclassified Sphingobium]KXU33814.1 hypothetical protein AXW74_00560 [Sphingobium sp. AM]KYC33759.1 hypothetical protein A0J57_04010 [Sphingobium sp. 22B]OAP33497.1 hypothetical protein A8O16_03230 [Sphingobium sp. 20006FA]
MNPQDLAAAVLRGERRAAARLISLVEAGDAGIEDQLRQLYRAGGHARIVGFTGPPGAGKSTLIDALVTLWRQRGERVAILAVDPSSPLSGGAVLGDRVRMSQHATDEGVFIRSMASKGAPGGLAHATGDALTILDAMRFDIILIETVGVGQGEIEILVHADAVVLLQVPQGGDGVQAVKAGVLEIADLILVNKSDAPGAARMIGDLREMAAHRRETAEGWALPVIPTEASKGQGVEAVIDHLDAFFLTRSRHPEDAARRRRRQLQARIWALAQAILSRRFQADNGELAERIDDLIGRRSDPHEVARALVGWN